MFSALEPRHTVIPGLVRLWECRSFSYCPSAATVFSSHDISGLLRLDGPRTAADAHSPGPALADLMRQHGLSVDVNRRWITL
jgi:hypothetical protein